VPHFATFNALLGAVGGDVRQHLPIASWGRLLASLGRAKHDRLLASGALDDDAVWLLERVPKEVAMSALPRALRTVLGQSTLATLVSLAARLGLAAPILLP
jgi:hypothetical protein